MDFAALCTVRKSCRAFTNAEVTKEEIQTLLEAAVSAPSAVNMQSWHFYVLQSPEARKKIEGACADWVSAAPVVFVICTDGEAICNRFGERAKTFIVQDTALAAGNILLQAADMGLGSCFIGAFDPLKIHAALRIPASQEVVALLPLGRPADPSPKRSRKPMADVVTFVEE